MFQNKEVIARNVSLASLKLQGNNEAVASGEDLAQSRRGSTARPNIPIDPNALKLEHEGSVAIWSRGASTEELKKLGVEFFKDGSGTYQGMMRVGGQDYPIGREVLEVHVEKSTRGGFVSISLINGAPAEAPAVQTLIVPTANPSNVIRTSGSLYSPDRDDDRNRLNALVSQHQSAILDNPNSPDLRAFFSEKVSELLERPISDVVMMPRKNARGTILIATSTENKEQLRYELDR